MARRVGSFKFTKNKWTWTYEHIQSCTFFKNAQLWEISMCCTFEYLSKQSINWRLCCLLRKIYCFSENLIFDIYNAIEFVFQLNGRAQHSTALVSIYSDWMGSVIVNYIYTIRMLSRRLHAILFDNNNNNFIFTQMQMQMLYKFVSLRLCITNIIIKTLLFVCLFLVRTSLSVFFHHFASFLLSRLWHT